MAAAKFSVKKAGGFSLGTGISNYPVFSDDGQRFAAIIANRAHVWDLNSHERIAICKSAGLTCPHGLALNADGSRLAMRGASGSLIDVFDVASGERIARIERSGQNDYDVVLSADGRRVFEITGGGLPGTLTLRPGGNREFKACTDLGPGFFVWDADTGNLLERHDLPLHGVVPDSGFMPTGLSQARSERLVVANFMSKDTAQKRGVSDFLWLRSDRGMQKIETGLHDSTAVIAPDGERFFVAGVCPRKKNVFRLLDRDGAVLTEKEIGAERTFPASRPAWSPDGKRLFWNKTTDDEAWLLDAATLEVERKIIWADAGAAFGPNGLIALAGTSGVVVPQEALEQAEVEIGQPAAERKRRKFEAYCKEVEARKANLPPIPPSTDGEVIVAGEMLAAFMSREASGDPPSEAEYGKLAALLQRGKKKLSELTAFMERMAKEK